MTIRATVVLIAVLAGGCATPTVWRWTSERGRGCYMTCRDARTASDRACGDRGAALNRTDKHQIAECQRASLTAEDGCRARCPDLERSRGGQAVTSDTPVNTDVDCWRLGICGRGECEARKGRCVRR